MCQLTNRTVRLRRLPKQRASDYFVGAHHIYILTNTHRLFSNISQYYQIGCVLYWSDAPISEMFEWIRGRRDFFLTQGVVFGTDNVSGDRSGATHSTQIRTERDMFVKYIRIIPAIPAYIHGLGWSTGFPTCLTFNTFRNSIYTWLHLRIEQL